MTVDSAVDFVSRTPEGLCDSMLKTLRRNGIAGVLCTRAADVREVFMDAERFAMHRPSLPGYDVFDVFGGLESVLQMDGEQHSRVRRLMNPAFSPKGLKSLRPAIASIIAERIDAIAAAGPEFDAMADFCNVLIMRALLDATNRDGEGAR